MSCLWHNKIRRIKLLDLEDYCQGFENIDPESRGLNMVEEQSGLQKRVDQLEKDNIELRRRFDDTVRGTF